MFVLNTHEVFRSKLNTRIYPPIVQKITVERERKIKSKREREREKGGWEGEEKEKNKANEAKCL